MRCHYLSDLHLESQDAPPLPTGGDVLIIAGDLCHARVLEAAADDGYAGKQRDRVLPFIEAASRRFARILLVPGNHDHYEGVLEDTAAIFRRRLPVTVLDDEAITLHGVRLFGTTLWSDFEGGDADAMKRAGKGCGEFFFVKRRAVDAQGQEMLARFRPPDALAAHQRALTALQVFLADCAVNKEKSIVISHHAPCRAGLNPLHGENGLNGAYASDLDDLIQGSGVAVWVHGHTHIRRKYRIGGTELRANCRGFVDKDPLARNFKTDCFFDV